MRRRPRRYKPDPRHRPCRQDPPHACTCKPGDVECGLRHVAGDRLATVRARNRVGKRHGEGGYNPSSPQRHRDHVNARRAATRPRKGV